MLSPLEEENKNLVINTNNLKYEIKYIKENPNLKPIKEYFDNLLNIYPLVPQIKNNDVRADFELLKSKVIKLMTNTDINIRLIDSAQNNFKCLMLNCNSMIEIYQVDEKSEENESVKVKKVNNSLIEVKSIKNNYLFNESLDYVLKNCACGIEIGNKIISNVDNEKNIAEIYILIAKMYDHLKNKNIIQNKGEQERMIKLINLKNTLHDLDNLYPIKVKEHRESIFVRRNLISSIELRNDEILMLKSDLESIETQIRNLKEELEENQYNQKKYEKKLQKFEEEAEKQMNLEITHKNNLQLKINDDFLKNVSLNSMEYYKDLKENFQFLNGLHKQLADEKMNVYNENLNLLKNEMTSQKNIKISLNNSIEKLSEIKKEKICLLYKQKKLLSRHEKDLEIINRDDISKLLEDLSERIVRLKNEIVEEEIIIRETEAKDKLSDIEAINGRFSELGFSKLDDYYEFVKLIPQFSDNYSYIQNNSSNYGENISNFSRQINKFAENINDTIKQNRTQELYELFDKKGGTENLEGLFDAISSSIDVNENSFTKDHVKSICNQRHILVDIMSQPNNRVNYAIERRILEQFLRNDKKALNTLNDEIYDIVKKKEIYKQKKRLLCENQSKGIENIEKEIKNINDILNNARDELKEDRDEWNKRKDELKQQKENLKEEKNKLILSNSILKDLNKENLKKIKESLKEKEWEKKEMEKKINLKADCFKTALVQIINVIEIWDRVEIEIKIPANINIRDAISHLAKEIKNF